jgi:uncharacterized protein with HEPN domain
MSKRDSSFYFIDIFIAIYKIKLYTSRFNNGEELLDSMLEWDATIRELEIIGEATNSLIKLKVLENKKYRKIVDFRNIIIHGYFGIDEDEVWDVVSDKLMFLYKDLKSIVMQQNISIKDAVYFAKEENLKNKELVLYIEKLYDEVSIQRGDR